VSTTPPQNPAATAGYTWSGDLAEVRVNALYAACHSLRFTGRLELRDESHEAQVVFLGGDPVEISGGDTQVIALWNAGQFRAVQSMPNLSGELTGQLEQTGSLAITKAPRLLAWVSEYRLSCDMLIERPGEKAQLGFKNGQLESAAVNGKPELAAMARVQAWTDGFYRVALRPLFTSGVIALKPPPGEGAAPEGREFDLSRSIPLDLKKKAQVPTPPAGVLSVGNVADASISAERAAMKKPPMARLSSGTDPVAPLSERPLPPMEDAAWAARSGGARWPAILLGALVMFAATGSALYYFHLPPFSAAPQPLDERRPSANVDPVKPVEPVAKVDTPEPVEKPVKPVDPATLEPKSNNEPVLPQAIPTDQRLIEKGRLLMMDGHPHSALSLFRKAEVANPKNPLAKTLQQQALGKLGRAELQLEGKGRVTIDGKSIDSPKKLRLFAGPHAIDTGNGPEELTLKKGERKKLRIRP